MSFPQQDWTPVILTKHTKPTTSENTKKVVKQTINSQLPGIKVKQIWDEKDPNSDPDIHPILVTRKFSQQIQKARIDKSMTQKQLANAICIPVSVINEYEQGKGIHNSNYISKIKKYLGITKHTI